MIPGRSATTLPILPRSFYERDPIQVARELLGAILVRRAGRGDVRAGIIVETEAYVRLYQGERDRAAHSDRGRTPRTEVLFGPGGHAYVYLIYGMHECLNVSAEPPGEPGCVLIRALEPVEGLAAMRAARRRPGNVQDSRLCAGPGNLTRALGVTRADNGLDLTSTRSPLTIASAAGRARGAVGTSGRIGIRHGTEWPLRFYLIDNKCISK